MGWEDLSEWRLRSERREKMRGGGMVSSVLRRDHVHWRRDYREITCSRLEGREHATRIRVVNPRLQDNHHQEAAGDGGEDQAEAEEDVDDQRNADGLFAKRRPERDECDD